MVPNWNQLANQAAEDLRMIRRNTGRTVVLLQDVLRELKRIRGEPHDTVIPDLADTTDLTDRDGR